MRHSIYFYVHYQNCLISNSIGHILGACGSVVVKALCYKPEGRGFDSLWGEFLNLLILPVALGPGVYSASNRNE
jgi:hypothetical protein